jgi:hypothetical protein
VAEALGKVHMHRRGLVWGWWWPVGLKLVFDQMVAPVPEIMADLCITVCTVKVKTYLFKPIFAIVHEKCCFVIC